MDDVFLQRYRITTNRMVRRDYASPGRYFVTICVQDRSPSFGNIRNGIMGLNEAGCTVADEIQRTPIIRPYVAIDDWVVMPDHVHVIMTIRPHRAQDIVHRGSARDGFDGYNHDSVHDIFNGCVETHRRCVSTMTSKPSTMTSKTAMMHQTPGTMHTVTAATTIVKTHIRGVRRGPGTLGSIIAQWKSACTRRIRAMGYTDFAWQRNYHDRVIRSVEEWIRIRRYIQKNPRRWNGRT
ncbi:MAG: hypothetical protein V1926_05990 [Candidatus Peregrinibacteria bacterium]